MNESFLILKSKLQKFIKKYQFYKLLKGIFLSISIYISFILIESVVEYLSYLSILSRSILFYSTLIFFIFVFILYIIFPIFSLFKLRESLNYKQASLIISKYFPEIDDKLLNTIELAALNEDKDINSELLLASIEQKTKELKPFKFNTAINFTFIKRNFVYLIVCIFILLLIYSFVPKVFLQGSNRIINHQIHFEKESPFNFNIVNTNFNIQQGDDFAIKLLIDGEYIPNEVFVIVGDNLFKMNSAENTPKNQFEFTIRNINNSVKIQFFADKFYSKPISINVLPSPHLVSFTVKVFPPKYTGFEFKTLVNTGDFTVPAGTKFEWNFETKNTNQISFITALDTNIIKTDEINYIRKTFVNSTKYQIGLDNEFFSSKEKMEFYINTIADEFPVIELNQIQDSLQIAAFYFYANIRDDYGFTKLDFVYNIKDKNDTLIEQNKKSIDINMNSRNQNSIFYFDFNSINTNSTEYYIEYYFQVYDNDYVNGFKSVKSFSKIFKPLSTKDIHKEIADLDEKTKNFIDKSRDLTEDIRKDIFSFKKKELNNELTNWDKQSFANSLVEKQKELDDLLNKLSNENQKRNNFNNQFYKEQKELLEKQKQIQKLLDQVLDDELRDLLNELNKLSEEFNNKEFEKVKKDFDISYKDLNEKLERSLELLKRYQVEENVLHTAEDLKKLADKQDKLSKDKISNKNRDDLIEKEKSLKEDFNQIKQKFEENIDNNNQLEKPFSLDKFDKSLQDINSKFNELDKNLKEKSNKKSKQNQDEISKQLKGLSEQMQKMFGNMNMQTLDLSMQDLRQIIDNLSIFSNSQEETYKLLKQTFINNPIYPNLIIKQNKLKNDFYIINDSLISLAKQIPQLNNLVIKEIKQINLYLDKSATDIEARHRRSSMRSQRFIINSANILALYLDELKEKMQNQKSGSKSGKGKKQSNSNDINKLKSQQKNFKEQLKQMLEEMKKGKGKMSQSEMNKRLVKMLQEQELFNKLVNEMQNRDGISPELAQKLKQIKSLTEKNIEDLINKNLDNNLLERNNKILTRLLEAEKAEKEREKENKRESEEAIEKIKKIPEAIKNQFKKDTKNKELLEKSNLNLKNYYRNLTKDYFNKVK